MFFSEDSPRESSFISTVSAVASAPSVALSGSSVFSTTSTVFSASLSTATSSTAADAVAFFSYDLPARRVFFFLVSFPSG